MGLGDVSRGDGERLMRVGEGVVSGSGVESRGGEGSGDGSGRGDWGM